MLLSLPIYCSLLPVQESTYFARTGTQARLQMTVSCKVSMYSPLGDTEKSEAFRGALLNNNTQESTYFTITDMQNRVGG